MRNEKIKWVTDTACDIPPDMARELDIEIMPFPIYVDGRDCLASDFTPEEFYRVLLSAKEIPVTSRIKTEEFFTCYCRSAEEGYTDLVNITINAKGSGTYESALMARERFEREAPGLAARMKVHVIDSRAYSFGYGHALVEGARRANGGDPVGQVLDYIRGWVESADIYLACYTLEFAKRSGRISSTAAFVGEMLGLRPVIRMVDGGNHVVEKVRGDKNVVPAVCERACKALVENGEYYIMRGMLEEPAQELARAMTERVGYPPLGVYPLGPVIAVNCGPKVVAVVVRGERRG